MTEETRRARLMRLLDDLDKWAGGLDEDDADRVWEVVYLTREELHD